MRAVAVILISFAFFFAKAQQNLNVSAPAETGGNYGTINFVDMSALGNKQVENVSYADISGSPFWEDKWNAALFFLKNEAVVKVDKARLNLYTDEVHFISKSNVELVCESDNIKKIIFFQGADTSKVLAVFELLEDSLNKSKLSYYKLLNQGKYRLLELKKVLLKEGDYNPTAGKNDYSFFSKTTYWINETNNKTAIPIKLNESSILPAIKPSSDVYPWLKKNNNSLKNVGEVISFLNYYNTK